MAANGDVIKSFLVGLGFDVDESSLAKFNKAVLTATVKVTALATGITAAAGGITKAITGISGDFETLGYQFRIISPAISKALYLRTEMLKAYKAAGINISEVVRNAVKLNLSITKTRYILDAIYKSVGAKFFTLLTKQSDQFREAIYKNLPKIIASLEKFVKTVFKAFEIVLQLGERLWSILTRVYDFFALLDEKTNGWSTKIIAVIAAWKLLNLGFLATPLGMLIAGFTALLALWDDFKTFKEGGKSLINWGSDMTKTLTGLAAIVGTLIALWKTWQFVAPVIETITKVMKALNVVEGITAAITFLLEAPLWAVVAVVGALIAALTILYLKWDAVKSFFQGAFGNISKGLGALGGGVLDFLGNAALPKGSPISPGAQNSNSATLNQQTNINVIGSADAGATGRSVATQQGRTNRDSIDYMVGSTR
jgi:hypothetical protein